MLRCPNHDEGQARLPYRRMLGGVNTRAVTNGEMERRQRLAFAIGEAMRQQKLTPPAVAQAIGRSPETIRRWMNAENVPSALDVGPLAAALGVDPSYLVDPPPVPEYPLDEYLVTRTTEEGVQRGLARSRRPPSAD